MYRDQRAVLDCLCLFTSHLGLAYPSLSRHATYLLHSTHSTTSRHHQQPSTVSLTRAEIVHKLKQMDYQWRQPFSAYIRSMVWIVYSPTLPTTPYHFPPSFLRKRTNETDKPYIRQIQCAALSSAVTTHSPCLFFFSSFANQLSEFCSCIFFRS